MNKKLKLTTLLLIAIICIATTNVQATYQSTNTGTVVKNNLVNGTTGFMTTVRQMEASGQVMGLSETVNTTTGVATSTSNNIDVHMQKNTEYGAMVILAVSDYGKQTGYIHNTTGGLATTTGNKSGVYELGTNIEFVAGGQSTAFSGYNARYYNHYTTTESLQHRGDATVETKKWQGSATYGAGWITSNGQSFRRADGGVSFSYYAALPTSSYYRTCCCCVRNSILIK